MHLFEHLPLLLVSYAFQIQAGEAKELANNVGPGTCNDQYRWMWGDVEPKLAKYLGPAIKAQIPVEEKFV